MFKKVDTYALRAVHHVFKSMACSLIQFFTSRSWENEHPGSTHPFFFDNSISQSIEIRVFHGFSLHLPIFHWVFPMGFPQLHGVSPCFPREFPREFLGKFPNLGEFLGTSREFPISREFAEVREFPMPREIPEPHEIPGNGKFPGEKFPRPHGREGTGISH